ncbi:hypothetical protein JHX96_08285 [Staphylococcus saccharolyticus]|uniref:hypothetical protein n=1 Tax=Staphylococcus saccharolyticus TaxID=33028 RepID=UPI00102D8620|nr:hypothetical protein [Staphylococcus saccharolyticus]MBL7573650.1 hypothetical protein [Staphylococcus saccharolyticus]MBL7584560.1 hypothetical protein [Staphylococcus saccharolyticus]MBL7639422.1 hypothetical protein [Staphylococcus saccharolyticus]QRJ68738.1 hypothetical protein DMB75_002520 [Staphylococcus saccharolyticus]TAA92056.1 hypothetical protein DMB74_08360 [Staphylococcus saccharolyticus]
MKKLFASVTILSLLLAGCAHGGNDKNEKKNNSSKTEQKDKQTNHDSKNKSNKQDNPKDKNSNQQQTNEDQQQTSSNSTSNQENLSSNQTQATQNNKDYVAPYYSRNATKVARNLSPFEGNQAQALQQLPNFKTPLNIAKNEANMSGNSNKTYNDYSIESTDDGYRYVFSFKDSSKKGIYSIVTVNRQGQPTVVDPNYQQ